MGDTFNMRRKKFISEYAYQNINNKKRMIDNQKISNRSTRTGTKKTIKKPKLQPKKIFTGSRKKMIAAILAAIATGTLTAGIGYASYQIGMPMKPTSLIALASKEYDFFENVLAPKDKITLSQAIQNGKTLESLGITKEQQQELQSYQEQLQNEDISNQELLEIASNVDGLQLKILKNKVGKLLNENPENVKVKATVNSSDYEESIQVENEYGGVEQNYSSSLTHKFLEGKGISGDISKFIRRVADMQTFMEKTESGNFDRSDVMNRVKDELEATSQFAAGEMQIDDKGNISIDTTEKNMTNGKENEER